ncbi:fructose-bisphosphate aldolase [Subtercola boreus]|uniref:Fructose-bisphosphate aldolase n=2 Tax=Subtercola boreus TaxID=120213 RepID=A0A3E0VB69_9MICO|nr:fructose-bisphosphate aldolase [Subtercola boreus]
MAQNLVAGAKGLLAIDESIGTCNRRFGRFGIPQTSEMRRSWRETLITTPGLSEFISGAILFDETIEQKASNGTRFLEILAGVGIAAGIKVDTGTVPLAGHPDEKITEGLDGLRQRLERYSMLGASFAKWRAVFAIDHGTPSAASVAANSNALARYAALCQEAGMVPVVEPEVLMRGTHSIQECEEATETVLRSVFVALQLHGVQLEGMILKPNMVVPGADSPNQVAAELVAQATVRCLRRVVPAAVPGVLFLSGGQPGPIATARLNAMNSTGPDRPGPQPWALGFSFGRAIQQPALAIWGGASSERGDAQLSVLHRARCNTAARQGLYEPAMENHQTPAIHPYSAAERTALLA